MQSSASASVPRPAPAPHHQHQHQRPHPTYHHHQQQQQRQQQQGVRLYDAPPRTTSLNGSAPSRVPRPLAHPTVAAPPSLSSSADAAGGDAYFTRAQVVDSRISYTDDTRRFVEYKIEIETTTRGTLYAWHRYSVFLQLAAMLQLHAEENANDNSGGGRASRREIPRLPSKKIFGNFSDATISARVEKLNGFLAAATDAEVLEWGIRIDDGSCVYKRSAAAAKTNSSGNELRDSLTSNTSTVGSSSPRRRRLSRLSLKAFSFRRGSTAE